LRYANILSRKRPVNIFFPLKGEKKIWCTNMTTPRRFRHTFRPGTLKIFFSFQYITRTTRNVSGSTGMVRQTHDIKPPCHGEEDAGYAGEVVGAMVKPIPVAILLRVYRLRAPFFSHTHPLSGKRCLPP